MAGQGRGWHGDSEGHRKAAKKSSGKFTEGSQRASQAGKHGAEARNRNR